jgi:hypothetical protein
MEMTDSEIREWLDSMDIYDYDICNGIVHVVGDVTINSGLGLTRIPVQFGYVGGDFYCSYNELTSLSGCPSEVGGDFFCSSNKLVSLDGGPTEVGGDFGCYSNLLVSLKGCPSEVGGYFNCDNNKLTSLECGPEVVGGDFYCKDNLFKDKPDTSHIQIGGMFKWK